MKTNIFPFQSKGKFPFPDDNKRQYHTDCLCHHSRQRGACHIPAESCDKQQIPYDIYHTRNPYKNKRHIGIADPPENTADHVIGNDKENTAAANADI